MINLLKKQYKLFFELVVSLSALFLIWNAEAIQEMISPQKYWQSKVNKLEKELNANRWKVQSLQIELQKEKISKEIIQNKEIPLQLKEEWNNELTIKHLEEKLFHSQQLLPQQESKVLEAKEKLHSFE